MTVKQFQYSKEEFIVISKQKTTDLQVELFVNKIYIMCISPLYACQQFFRWWNATRDHHQSKTQSLWSMKYYKGTHKCWISFKGRGWLYFILIPCTNSSSSCSFLFWRRKSVFVQNGFVHWGNITGLVVFRWGYVTSVWHGR